MWRAAWAASIALFAGTVGFYPPAAGSLLGSSASLMENKPALLAEGVNVLGPSPHEYSLCSSLNGREIIRADGHQA